MKTFLVWYVLQVIYPGPDKLVGELIVTKDLPSCEQMASRVRAQHPENSVKWSCHEMTVSEDATNMYINFPSN
jgi:hypothetical protein